MNIAIKLILAGTLGFVPFGAVAQDVNSNLTIEDPWVRVTMANRPAGGYMKLFNSGAQADKLLSASSSMAERIELHTHLMKDGIMRMRRVEHIDVPANGHVELKPGSLHFMIFGLSASMKKGGKLPLTIHFEKAGVIKVAAEIRGAGKMKMDMKMNRGSHSGDSSRNQ